MAAISTPVSPDVFPPDFTTTVGRIRALIPDVEQVDFNDDGTAQYIFADTHLEGLYVISVGEGVAKIYRAAASALRALAVSEGLIQKVIRTEDLQTDGAKLASALLAGAKMLEDQATNADDDLEIMQVVDFQPRPMDAFSATLRGFPTWWQVNGDRLSLASWL